MEVRGKSCGIIIKGTAVNLHRAIVYIAKPDRNEFPAIGGSILSK
jgi:hypothetical protein